MIILCNLKPFTFAQKIMVFNNEGNLADCRTTLKICPRIESWQHIYN